ncbi:MAG: NADH-quinone oxidoreductase subunit NuoE [Chloroflexota bacterium]
MVEQKIMTEAEMERLEAIIAEHQNQQWALLPLLERVQQEFGFIPPDSINPIAKALGLFPAQVQGVITFYAQLYTTPRGKNIVRVCRGTACHVRGGKTILKLVRRQLGIEEGEMTPDMEYSLETVACVGCCALAPNIVINRNIYGQVNPKKIASIFGHYGRQ